MNRLLVTLLFFLCTACSAAAQEGEIEYLLGFVEQSGCTFIRNGNEHPAGKARKHLELKYNKLKKRVKTADDFIDKIASQSSLTGRKYRVNCNGVNQESESWLKDALRSYRRQ